MAKRGAGKGAGGDVRLGIIGVGSMGSWHARSVLEGKVKRCRLAAVCDVRPEALKGWGNIPVFGDSRKLIRSGAVDAVLVATPHYFHAPISIDALGAGLHVLTEKPVAVHKADALRMAAAHRKHSRLVFAAMFQMRNYAIFRKLRSLIKAGELGPLRRVQWTATDWFRTDTYYASSGWRATWKGEGGGLLTNQCVHNLDIWQWLFGMPERVRGFCGFGRYHPIEVEDDVTAFFSYKNGMTGLFVASSGEAPGVNRLEIAGDRGHITVERGTITFLRNEVSASDFARKSRAVYETPDYWKAHIPAGSGGGDHAEVVANFVDAILDGAPLVAPAEEGIRQVELSNAIVFSAMEGTDVRLPMGQGEFARLLAKLARGSRKRLDDRGRPASEVPKYIVR